MNVLKKINLLLLIFVVSCGGNEIVDPNTNDEVPTDQPPAETENPPETITENSRFLGILDESFGVAGISAPVFDSGLYDHFYSAADAFLDTNNDVVISGKGWIYDQETGGIPLYANMISKINFENGLADSSFGGGDGSVSFYRNDYRKVRTENSLSIKQTSNSDFIAAGIGGVTKHNLTSGDFDLTFGSDSNGASDYYINDTQWTNMINEITVLTNGKFITCGDGMIESPSGETRSVSVITRYNANGTVDSSFGIEGVVFQEYNEGINLAEGSCKKVVETDSGYLVFGQYSYVENDSSVSGFGFAFSTLDRNGEMTSAGFNKINALPEYALFSNKAIPGPSGSLLIAASLSSNVTYETKSMIFKINKNGELDFSFGEDGIKEFEFGTYNSTLSVDDSGKVLVALNESNKISLYRLTEAGSVDERFGLAGKVQVPLNEAPVFIKAVGDNIIGVTSKVKAFKLK